MVTWNIPIWEEDDDDRPPHAPPRFEIRRICREIQQQWTKDEEACRRLGTNHAYEPYPVRFYEQPDPRCVARDNHDKRFNGGGDNSRPDQEWWVDQIGARANG